MPYLNKPIQAAGLTDFELEQAIIKAYRDASLIDHAQVSVTVLEARGRAFSIIGAVNKPGEYLVQETPFRLFNAIAMASGLKPDAGTVGVARANKTVRQGGAVHLSGNVRMVQVPAAKLLAGDETLNLIVRPGDTVIVGSAEPPAAAAANVVRLMVAKDSLQLGGKAMTWPEIAQSLEKLPDRANTVIELAPASDEVPIGRFFDAQSRARALVSRLGLKRLTVIESTPPAPRAENPTDRPFVFIGGHVQRPGAYANYDGKLTLRQLLQMAGIDNSAQAGKIELSSTLRGGKQYQETIPLGQLLHPAPNQADPDRPLLPGDAITVIILQAKKGN